MSDLCNWFPQAPHCGHGRATSSCEFREACLCDEGWTTDFETSQSVYEAYLSQCNTEVEVYESQQANQTNRTTASSGKTRALFRVSLSEWKGLEPVVETASTNIKNGRLNVQAVGVILVALVVMLLAFWYWRKKRRQNAQSQSRYQEHEQMPHIHPYLSHPYSFGMMYPPSPPMSSPWSDTRFLSQQETPQDGNHSPRNQCYRSTSNEELPLAEYLKMQNNGLQGPHSH